MFVLTCYQNLTYTYHDTGREHQSLTLLYLTCYQKLSGNPSNYENFKVEGVAISE